MRKKILLLASLTMGITINAEAQLPNGSIAPDWTLTDINGTERHLYSDLNEGRAVFIDVSATWCSPCWALHESGILEDLWVNHGPSGGTNVINTTTDDVIVYFIEADGTTNSADLHGTGSSTQGDWVTGVSHPIIDPALAQAEQFMGDYQIEGFPTLYRICPDRTIKAVGGSTGEALYAYTSSCPTVTNGLDARIINSDYLNENLGACDSINPLVILSNLGTTTLTSATLSYSVDGVLQKTFNWTGSLLTYENVVIDGIKIGAPTSGNHTLTVTVSNPNSGTDMLSTNNSTTLNFSIYSETGIPMFTQTFESGAIPSTWNTDNGGNSLSFAVCPYAYNSSKGIGINWIGSVSGNTQTMDLGLPIDFSSATVASLKFDLTYATGNSTGDKLEIEVSSDCGETWTNVYSKSGENLATTTAAPYYVPTMPTVESQWRHELVNLNAYAGEPNVLIRFKGTAGTGTNGMGGNNAFIDNINISATAGLSNLNENSSLSIYPNPAIDFVTVQLDLGQDQLVIVEMINSVGQVVYTAGAAIENGQLEHNINTKLLEQGLYIINIYTENSLVSKKISVIK